MSQARLREKLLARFPEAEVAQALERLLALGYLDDRAFAETFVAVRRKYGPLKLRHLLRARGGGGGGGGGSQGAWGGGGPRGRP